MTSKTRTLIVGGASGMSKATARLLLEDGGSVVLVGRQRNRLEVAQQDLAHPGRVEIAALDLAEPAAVRAFSARIPTEFPDLTGLVNGAGVFLPKPFLEHAEEDYDRYLDLNRGTFFLTQAVARAIRRLEGSLSDDLVSPLCKAAGLKPARAWQKFEREIAGELPDTDMGF
ncbi:hypothetical protein DDZ14_08975 [Maritimibacter sp. 55A14]|uniref:SDR family NAD(P)-dependent oxidoreductase n=1 Tax=Maritimibacter sp. 55A14 TaxID=2174844 RepID=UPI000D6049D9|nr:SDR family NAD(P)-dependent oxidoreductase [Maritimibacter sp. 55A14]PWE32862.1 hypothetical protein DDZ14_08975 [Maritimibacter sp. 55A14]